ncbi:MAG: glycosyltransferase family 4 protein [Cloacibacterium sp.]|nr:glycosyltransferase family 4 protein [Cloacibacterium sp.]
MNKIKHILFVTKEFQCDFQKNSGGTGVFYNNLSQELLRMGYQISVFGSSRNSFKIDDENFSLLFVKDYFKKNKLAELFRSLTGKFSFLEKFHYLIYNWEKNYLKKNLKTFISDKEIDVIETHDWEGLCTIVEDLKIPYAVRFHGSWSVLNKFFGYGASKGKIIEEKRAFANVKNCITISKFNEKTVRETFGDKKFHLIYNGIDTDFYRPLSNVKIQPKSIFYLGSVSVEKGAEIAFEAFLEIVKIEKNATLHFIGKETHLVENLQKKISENCLEDKIIFYGKKNPNEIVELISKAEVVFFPSKGENFSLALLEVLAIGKPVICSDIESFREVIKDGKTGMIAKSKEDFVEKTLFIFNNKNFSDKTSLQGSDLIKEKFSLKNMAEETINYYKTII